MSPSKKLTCKGTLRQLFIRVYRYVPEFIDPRFRENKPRRSYSVIENERFGLVFAKTVSIISGMGLEVQSVM